MPQPLETIHLQPALPIEPPPAGEGARRPASRGWKPGRLLWPLAALLLLLLYNWFMTPGFFHIEVRDGRLFGSLVDVLNRGVPVGLLALGMTLVIATGGIDLSVGAVMAIAGAVAASLIARPEGSPLAFLNVHGSVTAVILLTLAVAMLAGLWNGLLVSGLQVQPIVATLILMVAGRGVAQLLTAGQIITFENPAFQFLGGGFLAGVPFTIFIAAAAYCVVALLTRVTALGLFIEAVGNNSPASIHAGVNARQIKLIVYLLSGLCAGVAGMIATADIKAADANNAGLYLELDAILAVAIGGGSLAGGRFTLLGTVLGVLVIQTLTTTILTQGVPPALTLVIKAVVVIAVCLLQSEPFRAAVSRGTHRAGRRKQ
jgi:simple sugar transport system permease protein